MPSSTASGTSCESPGRVEVLRPAVAGQAAKFCPIYVGTCGYSYNEWLDSGFYPEGTKSAAMLGLYGRCFSVVELNYTWYQMARAEAMARMIENAPPHLLFAAKLTRTMTHERDNNWREQLALYRQGIAPLGKRLVAVLVQLPPDFDRSLANRNYLAALLDGLAQLPVAVVSLQPSMDHPAQEQAGGDGELNAIDVFQAEGQRTFQPKAKTGYGNILPYPALLLLNRLEIQ